MAGVIRAGAGIAGAGVGAGVVEARRAGAGVAATEAGGAGAGVAPRADEDTSDRADAALVELLSFLDSELAEEPQKKKQKTASAASLFE